jgi:hypothetical protein
MGNLTMDHGARPISVRNSRPEGRTIPFVKEQYVKMLLLQYSSLVNPRAHLCSSWCARSGLEKTLRQVLVSSENILVNEKYVIHC